MPRSAIRLGNVKKRSAIRLGNVKAIYSLSVGLRVTEER
ncbi:hypothetical protein LTSEGIV_3241 [Salmonella enterica subsp. enterica serovar Give str. S5-487]|nr:hypothetical protein LTSEGIV_3241 [Salmonella enterica subsp. enterica serovar Give str. S5-487]